MDIRVWFDDTDRDLIRRVAERRVRRAGGMGRGHGEGGHDLERRDIIGAAGERAYAKHRRLPWPFDEDDFGKRGDFPDHVEVRSCAGPNGRNLISYDRDRAGLRLVLVIVDRALRFADLAGWLPIDEARRLGKRSPWLRPGSPPQLWTDRAHLRPLP